jgi:hypothetical protein
MKMRYTSSGGEFIPGRVRWWQWPTILALDAPAVALTWQAMLARVAGVVLLRHHVVLLGISVWLAYAADRWIEGWRLSTETVRTQRHYFYLRWRWSTFVGWIVVLMAGVTVAMIRFTSREWMASLTLLVPTLLYLLSHQLLHREHPWRVPKEVCIAALIACGAALYPATLVNGRLHLLLAPTALFMLLCLANCLLISVWESEVDRTHRQTSLALQLAPARVVARGLPYGLVALGLGMAMFSSGATRTAAWCGAASAGLLATLNLVQPRIGRERARVLADITLLTPLIAMLLKL